MNIIVNAVGLDMIAAWLGEHHVGGADLSHANVHAWAADIERHAEEGLGAYFELRAHESLRGRAEVFDLPVKGYDSAPAEVVS